MTQRAAAAQCVAAAAECDMCNLQRRPAAAKRPAAQACRVDSSA